MSFETLRDRLRSRLSPTLQVLAATFRAFAHDECGLRAAAMSYHALLSVFPLLLFLLFIAGVAIGSGETQQVLLTYLRRAIPELADPATRLIERTIAARASFGLLGAAGLLWTSSALFAVLTSTFNVIWSAAPRPLWRRRLIGVVTVLALAILFIFSLLIRALSAFEVMSSGALSQQWVNLGADLGVTIVLSWILYTWLPNRKIDWRFSLSGAVLAALLWQIAKTAFSLYLSVGPDRFGAIYGSLGSLIVLVLWVYFSSMILFLGAEFAASLQAYEEEGKPPLSEAGFHA